MKHIRSVIAILGLAVTLCLTSCSDSISGYGMLLWSIPEHNLSDCDVVPVYIKSNISQTYVIGIPGTDEKLEVPLWQITDPVSKRKTEQKAERYLPLKHMYARVVLDGLPIRADAANTAKQVYRLRENEIIKVLYKGNGAAVMAGTNNQMQGEWYRVMAKDGTLGWCFSYNLRIYDETVAVVADVVEEEQVDEYLEAALSSRWYPDYYNDMVRYNQVSVERMRSQPAFDPGRDSGTIHFEYDDISVSYPYNGVTTTSEYVYRFNDAPFVMTIKRTGYIVLQYTDDSGKPQAFDLVTLTAPVDEIIAQELERRTAEYEMLQEFGPDFSSSNYGDISFGDGNLFTWTGWRQLVPSVFESGIGNTGNVSIKYFVDTKLSFSYDGVLTFVFSSSGKEYNFLYKREDTGLRLENVDPRQIKDGVVKNRATSPVVMFFTIAAPEDSKQNSGGAF
ncbi:MAG: SH3 domain-containing protein [Treponema sp.]|nr:SH3 domain-containing protein [Candidatus Treponema caballi]